MPLDTNIEDQKDQILVKMKGDLDIYSSDEFAEKVGSAYDEGKKDMTFDMSGLDYIDSTGLGAFMTLYKKSKDSSQIRITHAKDNIKKIFEITELDKLFRID